MIMQSRIRLPVLATALLVPWALAMAQQQTEEAPGPAIEPEALAALDGMGQFLDALQRFEVRAETLTDEVLVENGQKIQLGSTGDYRVQRPDRLFADVASDRKQRQYFY